MKRSRKRNISLSVLGLSLAVLGADRVFLGASDGVTEVAASTVIAKPLAAESTARVNPVSTPFAAVSARLEEVLAERGADPAGLPDIFRRPIDWADPSHVVSTVDARTPLDEEFLADHRFTAVMVAGGESMAVIDGRAQRVGTMIGDFTLADVGARHVVVERFGQSVRIELDVARRR